MKPLSLDAAQRILEAGRIPPPWWAPGLIITPELRATYNRYLPPGPILRALRHRLAATLPGPAWVPLPLRPPGFLSMPDFWHALPPHLAGRLRWRPDELPALAAAIAAPARFGTRAARYPEQLALIRDLPSCRLRTVVDLACGTGQDTWEIARHLPDGATIIGVTREPLEAWMAHHRCLPHWSHADRRRLGLAFPPPPPEAVHVAFVAGDALAPPTPPADLVICNGLIGGPALHQPKALAAIWDALRHATAPGGAILIGDRFHQGHAPALRRFLEHAKTTGTCHRTIGPSHLLKP